MSTFPTQVPDFFVCARSAQAFISSFFLCRALEFNSHSPHHNSHLRSFRIGRNTLVAGWEAKKLKTRASTRVVRPCIHDFHAKKISTPHFSRTLHFYSV